MRIRDPVVFKQNKGLSTHPSFMISPKEIVHEMKSFWNWKVLKIKAVLFE
jgi:hypothetical protein